MMMRKFIQFRKIHMNTIKFIKEHLVEIFLLSMMLYFFTGVIFMDSVEIAHAIEVGIFIVFVICALAAAGYRETPDGQDGGKERKG